MSKAECYQESFHFYGFIVLVFACFKNNSIWVYSRSMGYLVLGSWSPKKCLVCFPSCEVVLVSHAGRNASRHCF